MFTFTSDELRQLLQHTCNELGKCDDVYDFSLGKASQLVIAAIMNGLLFEASQPQRDTLLENSLPAIDEDEIFTDALKSDPPIFCPDCGDELSSIETGDKTWCMRCGYTSNNSLDNISPAELGLLPAA